MKRNAIASMLLSLAWPMSAGSEGIAHVPLPFGLSGTLNGAEYQIQVPANWNGTLLIFAHGTQLQPGVAEIAPVAWPLVSPSVEEQLLASGYALAGSGYENSPKDGVHQTLSLTNFFKGKVGNPGRIIVWGNSLGGLVALKAVEEHPGVYDGAIANCAPCAGRGENMDWALAFGLAYAAAFGWPEAAWGPLGDLRDNLNFFTEVRPIVPWPPSNYGGWEFIRLIMRLPATAFWGSDPQTNSYFFGLGMWKATGQRAAAEAEAGGPVAENAGFEYTLTPQETAYLASLGVNADELLATMNTLTISAERSARNHVEHWGGLTGRIRRPVLTMHSVFDGFAPVYNESAYKVAVAETGMIDNLIQAYVSNVGHCSFSAGQYLSTVTAMNDWIETGMRPGTVALPTAHGFNLEYVPPVWPF